MIVPVETVTEDASVMSPFILVVFATENVTAFVLFANVTAPKM